MPTPLHSIPDGETFKNGLEGRDGVRRTFAARLKNLRRRSGYATARGFAIALGISENRYTRYERAEVEPDLYLISRICKILNVTPSDIVPFSGGDDGPETADSFDDVTEDCMGADRGAACFQPDGGIDKIRTDALAWQLSCIVVDLTRTPSSENSDYDGERERLETLRMVSAQQREIISDPFGAIARIVRDRAVQTASAASQQTIFSLCASLAEAYGAHSDLLSRRR